MNHLTNTFPELPVVLKGERVLLLIIIVVEYWAKFNEVNCYSNWKELADRDDIEYYRVDIAKAPLAKKKYRVRMAPTMFIITRDNLVKFKAGLDLEFPVSVEEVNEAIEEIQNSNRF